MAPRKVKIENKCNKSTRSEVKNKSNEKKSKVSTRVGKHRVVTRNAGPKKTEADPTNIEEYARTTNEEYSLYSMSPLLSDEDIVS